MPKLSALLLEKKLTPRETDVLNLLVKGKTNLEIATDLILKERTIKWHITSIYIKMGVKSRSQLIVACLPLILSVGPESEL